MARLFFALWPNDEIRTQLDNVAKQFRKENIKLIKESNLHITLEFLGEVSDRDKEELIEKINKIHHEPFDIKLTRVGWWRKPQILWIGTTHIQKPLLKLVKSIRKCVKQQGLKTDKREYKPHVTIARKVKQVFVPKETFHIDWHVESFVLVISKSTDNGVEYNVIKDWPLIN